MVSFFCQDVNFTLKNKRLYKNWLTGIAQQKGQKLKALAVVFCSDIYLLDLNRRFLGHDYYTDVITFAAHLEGKERASQDKSLRKKQLGIEGDICISIDTVRINAEQYGASFLEELARVMAHGLLHLLGYKDVTPKEQAIMRQEEERALYVLHTLLG